MNDFERKVVGAAVDFMDFVNRHKNRGEKEITFTMGCIAFQELETPINEYLANQKPAECQCDLWQFQPVGNGKCGRCGLPIINKSQKPGKEGISYGEIRSRIKEFAEEMDKSIMGIEPNQKPAEIEKISTISLNVDMGYWGLEIAAKLNKVIIAVNDLRKK